jgi:hypothetical protein
MAQWYKVTFKSDDVGIGGKPLAMQNVFYTFFISSGSPERAAILANHSDDLNEHVYYFTPDAARIAKPVIDLYGGSPSEAPTKPVRLAVGHCGLDDWRRAWNTGS